MRAQPLAKRFVQQMRRRVVGADRGAAIGVDGQLHGVADLDPAFLDFGIVHEHAAKLLGGIGNDRLQPGLAGDGAAVADLAATLAIERRLVDDDRDALASGRAVDPRAILDQRQHLTLAGVRGIA